LTPSGGKFKTFRTDSMLVMDVIEKDFENSTYLCLFNCFDLYDSIHAKYPHEIWK